MCTCFVLLTFCATLFLSCDAAKTEMSSDVGKMRIAVVGAGASGLTMLRKCILEDVHCDVFEQTGEVGGVWNFINRTGLDENGIPVHSPMYKGLMTNLPKEVMSFLEFPFPKGMPSYISQPEMLKYINTYADTFDLRKHIKFYTQVTNIEPIGNSTKWSVTIRDAKTKNVTTETYDAVAVCIGHYSVPFIPRLRGIENYKGKVWHSHDYRTPEIVAGKEVLIIGQGPSGRDIARLIVSHAKKVYLSHRPPLKILVPKDVVVKPQIDEFLAEGAKFSDGSEETFDEVLYCTGYKYSFPFLAESCGITIDDNWVQPLYKEFLNINYPTMALFRIPNLVCPFPTIDIQARFFLAYLKGNFTIPSKEEMLSEWKRISEEKVKEGISKQQMHLVKNAWEQDKYFQDLARIAGIKKIPRVLSSIYDYVKTRKVLGNCDFEIVDDENFITSGC